MRTAGITLAGFLAALVATGCGAPKKKADVPHGTVTITLDRAAGSHDIDVVLHVLDAGGLPVTGAPPGLTVTGGAASAIAEAGGGDYTATVTPDVLDTEVTVRASTADASATKIALPFSTIDDAFGQPEALDGLVNSPGWEDGENISPDGQWLIVASYVPIDLFSCVNGGGTMSTPACATINGPVAAPQRPDLFGASRVHNGTYDSICPDLGITTPLPFALAPVNGYGFHRQADGSFAEPFVINFDADGCLAPYGNAFTGQPSGTAAGIVIAYDDNYDAPDNKADLYYAPITLGQKNVLGTYRFTGGAVQQTGFITTRLDPVLPYRQGNPSYGGGLLFWDNEDLPADQRDLYAAHVTGTLPSIATVGSAFTLGMSLAGQEEIQPSIDTDGRTLYWFGAGGGVSTATLTSGADPALAGSWSAPATLLAPAPGAVHPILAAGEPNMAHVAGKRELYFVYIKKTAAGGYDANVGRVRER